MRRVEKSFLTSVTILLPLTMLISFQNCTPFKFNSPTDGVSVLEGGEPTPILSYDGSTGTTVTAGRAMSVAPSKLSSSGAITGCGISGGPALPPTLTIEPTTCVISGTPTAALAATTFDVVATDSIGHSTPAPVTLTVNPPALAYPPIVANQGTYDQTLTRFMSLGRPNKASANSALKIGAIRWDFHFRGSPYKNSFGRPQFHYRFPFYAGIFAQNMLSRPDGTFDLDPSAYQLIEDDQTIIDQEIKLAAAGGLDYWAFLYYPSRELGPGPTY